MTISTTTLKNAAFAIEHDLFTDPDGCNYLVKDGAILRRWEPEHSSEDSFELAVKLHLDIDFYWDGCNDQYDEVRVSTHGSRHDTSEQIGYFAGEQIDEFAATRWAILQSAAKIGAAL